MFASPREWASLQIALKFFIDPNFGGALIPIAATSLMPLSTWSGVAFLTEPRQHFSPVISRLRFEAIDNLALMDVDL